MIYTSYFANIPSIPFGVQPISIALRRPWRYVGREYVKLAPPPDVLEKYRRDKNETDYIREYRERVLNRLNPDEVVRELYELADLATDGIALICYEKPEKFCHRHLVADWLNEHGIECMEWANNGKENLT